ncbi:branched-chain amino acid transaminase [Candidatus Parcubacteria bacterium]|nr:branched-chain amino acid transaminase [Candidatus Parcubacteria bacterium]
MSSKPFATPYDYAYFEGKIIPIKEAKLSIMTNALHYGGGIYGGLKIVQTPTGPAVFRLEDHIKRLQDSIKILGFPYKFSAEKIKAKIFDLAKKNKISAPTYIRPIIYRSDLNLSPGIAGDYELAIYMLKIENYFDKNQGLKVCISDWVRNNSKSIPPSSKATGGYINSALAINEARQSGFDSAIMLDKNGDVSEGAVMNIFLAKEGKLITPSLDSDILGGITRRTILEIASEQGIEVEERKVKKEELFAVDEIFFSGTATGITWCRQVNDKQISSNPGTITTKMVDLFAKLPKSHPELFAKVT